MQKYTQNSTLSVSHIARYGHYAHIGQSSKHCRIQIKEIKIKNLTNPKELLRIYGFLEVNLVDRADIYVKVLGKPLVCAALTAQFISNCCANMYVSYIHRVAICAKCHRFRNHPYDHI